MTGDAMPDGLMPEDWQASPSYNLTFAEAIQGMMRGLGARFSFYSHVWFMFKGPTLMECTESMDIFGTKYVGMRPASIVKIMVTGKWRLIEIPKKDPVCSGLFLGEMEELQEKNRDLEKEAKRFDRLAEAINSAYKEFEKANPAEPNPFDEVLKRFYESEESE